MAKVFTSDFLSKRSSKGRPTEDRPLIRRPKGGIDQEYLNDLKQYSPEEYKKVVKEIFKDKKNRQDKKVASTSTDVKSLIESGVSGQEGTGGKYPSSFENQRIQGGNYFSDVSVFVDDEKEEQDMPENSLEKIKAIQKKYRDDDRGEHISAERYVLDSIKRGGLDGLIYRLARSIDFNKEYAEPLASYYSGLASWLGQGVECNKKDAMEHFARAVEKGSRGASMLIHKIKIDERGDSTLSELEEDSNSDQGVVVFKRNLDYTKAMVPVEKRPEKSRVVMDIKSFWQLVSDKTLIPMGNDTYRRNPDEQFSKSDRFKGFFTSGGPYRVSVSGKTVKVTKDEPLRSILEGPKAPPGVEQKPSPKPVIKKPISKKRRPAKKRPAPQVDYNQRVQDMAAKQPWRSGYEYEVTPEQQKALDWADRAKKRPQELFEEAKRRGIKTDDKVAKSYLQLLKLSYMQNGASDVEGMDIEKESNSLEEKLKDYQDRLFLK